MRPPKHQIDDFTDLHFPAAGIDRSSAFSQQPNRDLGGGIYARTTPSAVNVRAFEATQHRARGGSRSGLTNFVPSQVVADWIIQGLSLMVGTDYPPPGGTMQTSQSGRVVTVVAVSKGKVFVASQGDTAWHATTNLTGDNPPLIFSGLVFSSPNIQKLWFADGSNYVFYQPSDSTVRHWVASAGTLPLDSENNTPRLICTWRGRMVLSGLLKDSQNWFMSKVNDPTNFDYSPLSRSPVDAIAGNNAPQGLIGDTITSLCPYSDDVLLFFGDHTIYMLRGDPLAGGQIDLISDAIGGVWGQCWCKDPYGNVYFMSNKCGVYKFTPGQQPVRISQAIEELLASVDTGTNVIRLIWNDRSQGFHLFITPDDAPTVTTHFFFEERTGAWWTDSFGNNNHNPVTCCDFDGNLPGDRAALIGSWDGYVRILDPDAADDDGTRISSSVLIGPLLTANLDEIVIKDLQAVLGNGSADVDFEVLVGATAETALASTPVSSGTWKADRNLLSPVRKSNHACYIRLTATSQWAMEQVRVRLATQGKVRRRGH